MPHRSNPKILKHGAGDKGAKFMANLGGKGGMGESNEETLKGKPKSQVRRSLKDILQKANSAQRKDSGESKTNSRKGSPLLNQHHKKGVLI